MAQWDSVGHPMALVDAMWNHAATMRAEFARRKLTWPELTSQDLTDMLVYLRNLPSTRNAAAGVEITSGANGQALFESKGCAACHASKIALAPRLKGMTLIDIAVAMWNHAAQNANRARTAQRRERCATSRVICGPGSFLKTGATPRPAGAYSRQSTAPPVMTITCERSAKAEGRGPIVYRRHDGLGALAPWSTHARPDEKPRHRVAAFRRSGNGQSDCVSKRSEREEVKWPIHRNDRSSLCSPAIGSPWLESRW